MHANNARTNHSTLFCFTLLILPSPQFIIAVLLHFSGFTCSILNLTKRFDVTILLFIKKYNHKKGKFWKVITCLCASRSCLFLSFFIEALATWSPSSGTSSSLSERSSDNNYFNIRILVNHLSKRIKVSSWILQAKQMRLELELKY